MENEIKSIYLAWRPSSGKRRIIIGEIKLRETGDIIFRYIKECGKGKIKEGVEEAKKHGFTSFYGLPYDDKREYKGDELEVIFQRLNNSKRQDIKQYYEYWEISEEKIEDKFYILAQTQGLLSTDNFEFLADYYPTKYLSFVSEISGLSKTNIKSEDLSEQDELRWVLEKNNEYDEYAVRLYKEDLFLGYVKKIHNRVFHDKIFDNAPNKLKVKVKSLIKNGHIKQAFISIKAE